METIVGTKQDLMLFFITSKDDETKYELKEYKPKRSKSQNSFYWKLVNDIANVMNLSKEEVHFKMLKAYGQREVISMLSTINPSGYFQYYEAIGIGIVNNKEFTHYSIYKRSSDMNTNEMRILLDGTINEAENLGIHTLSLDEVTQWKLN